MSSYQERIAALEKKLADIEQEIKANNSNIKKNIINNNETTKIINNIFTSTIDNDISTKSGANSSSTNNVNYNTSSTTHITDTAFSKIATQAKYEVIGATANGNSYIGVAGTNVGVGARSWTELGVLAHSIDLTAIKWKMEAGPKKTFVNLHAEEDTVNSAVQNEINILKNEISSSYSSVVADMNTVIASKTDVLMNQVSAVNNRVDNTLVRVDSVANATKMALKSSICSAMHRQQGAMLQAQYGLTILS